MITCHGRVSIPDQVIQNADSIKLENYKTNTPAKFQVRHLTCEKLMEDLASLIGISKERLDYVYFSCCKGAEPHTDKLNPKKFEDRTFVIPVILPSGKSVIVVQNQTQECHIGDVYEFDHTKTHAMYLDDNESGCVVIMVAIFKEGWGQ